MPDDDDEANEVHLKASYACYIGQCCYCQSCTMMVVINSALIRSIVAAAANPVTSGTVWRFPDGVRNWGEGFGVADIVMQMLLWVLCPSGAFCLLTTSLTGLWCRRDTTGQRARRTQQAKEGKIDRLTDRQRHRDKVRETTEKTER